MGVVFRNTDRKLIVHQWSGVFAMSPPYGSIALDKLLETNQTQQRLHTEIYNKIDRFLAFAGELDRYTCLAPAIDVASACARLVK